MHTNRLRPELQNAENGEIHETEGLLVNNIGVYDRAYRRMIDSKLNPVHKKGQVSCDESQLNNAWFGP